MVNDNEKEKEEHFKNEPESEALYGWLDGGGNERIRIADKTSSFCCGALVATLILIFTNAILIPRLLSSEISGIWQIYSMAISAVIYLCGNIWYYLKFRRLSQEHKTLVRDDAIARLKSVRKGEE